MKLKTWQAVAVSAKLLSRQPQVHVYQPALASLTSIRNHLIDNSYCPLYKQPSRRSFSSSSLIPAASPELQLPEQSHHLPLSHHKTLPLFDFFSKSYAKAIPSYIFAHGASGFAKSRNRYTTPDNKIRLHNEHYYSIQIGEDAYFRRSDALGVADGVGGWAGVSGKNELHNQRKRCVVLKVYHC